MVLTGILCHLKFDIKAIEATVYVEVVKYILTTSPPIRYTRDYNEVGEPRNPDYSTTIPNGGAVGGQLDEIDRIKNKNKLALQSNPLFTRSPPMNNAAGIDGACAAAMALERKGTRKLGFIGNAQFTAHVLLPPD